MKRAVIRNGKIVYDVAPHTIKPNETAAHERREAMKLKHRKDLLQPRQTDYYRAYPEQAKDLPDETRRLLS
jgi:hypothetical protein